MSQAASSAVAWSDHKAFVLGGLRSLLETGRSPDFEIKCHDTVFKVHKLILSLFTDYFETFDGLWTRIDIGAASMHNILRFIYHGQVVMRYDEMESFLSSCCFASMPSAFMFELLKSLISSSLQAERKDSISS